MTPGGKIGTLLGHSQFTSQFTALQHGDILIPAEADAAVVEGLEAQAAEDFAENQAKFTDPLSEYSALSSRLDKRSAPSMQSRPAQANGAARDSELPARLAGSRSLVFDLIVMHERFGSSGHPQQNGLLTRISRT